MKLKREAIRACIMSLIFLLSNVLIFSPKVLWAQSRALVAYWNFDEGYGNLASDSSGNGNTGTLVNGPQRVNGVAGKELKFDGKDDYVYVPHSSSLDSARELTCVSGSLLYPRGGINNRISVKYLCDTNPDYGWNTDLRYNDANWLEGRTPIGIGEDRFIRTKLPFNDFYVRKIFSIDKISRNAILSIASDDGTDVWINGKKILNDLNSVHGPWYWNYRLNITEYLKTGENLLAVHVKNGGGGPCYFDFELLLQEDSLEEIALNFVKGRLNSDGGFSNDYIDDTFYATSILKTLNSIDIIDREKVGFWVLSHKSVHGDFGNWVAWQNPAVGSLKNLGLELDGESTERLITVLINWRSSDGSWGNNLWDTWHSVEALASLNALNRIGDWDKTVNFIKSLQGGDGGFSNRLGETTYLRFTFYAIRSLQLLNALNSIDKSKAISFIKSCYTNGGFSDRPEWGEWVESTYWGVESLGILNSLNEVDSGKIAGKVVSWLGDKGSTGYLYGDYCVVMTLKILNKLSSLDKTKLVNNVIVFQNAIDGGFKYGSRLYDTEHALRILSNIGMLNRVDGKKIEQWVLSQPFYYWGTGDIHSAIYCLKTLNALQKTDVKNVVDELLKHQLPDGGFGGDEDWRESNLWETYLAIDTLQMLNRISSINKEKIVNYVLSLKNPDGSFRYSMREEHYDEATPLAVIILTLLGETHRIDEKTIEWTIKNQREDGGFGDILHTYLSLKALQDLGRLENTVLTKIVNYALSLQNLDGGFGWWKGDVWSWLDSTDYGMGILKILNDIGAQFIRVFSPYGISSGEGWYVKGSIATFLVSPTIVDHGNGTRHVFLGWYGDGNLLSRDPRYSLVVEKPLRVLAVWGTEYFAQVSSLYGTATGGGWYAKGSTVTISISQTVIDHGNGTRRIFNAWREEGSLMSNMKSFTIIVNEPRSIVAVWDTEYEVRVLSEKGTTEGSGWFKSGDTATVSISPTVVEKDFLANHVFEGWRLDGKIVSTLPTYSFVVDRPVTLVASWRTEVKPFAIGLGITVILLIIATTAVLIVKRKRKPSTPSLQKFK